MAIFIAQLALPRMKAAKPASQIKSFVRLFGSHAPKYTSVFFFRHTLTDMRRLGLQPILFHSFECWRKQTGCFPFHVVSICPPAEKVKFDVWPWHLHRLEGRKLRPD
jgi:hypothetical protein